MPDKTLALLGAGVVTDAYADVTELARDVGASLHADVLNPETLAALDPLPALAIRSLHQAFSMAGAKGHEHTALIVVTQWGMIDATVSYLDTMLEANGKFASPRHFTRSVYSAATSLVAIHFGINGPCQSLAFDSNEDVVTGALAQAWRLLAAGRCDRVALVWGDQQHPLAVELAQRAARDLRRKEYEPYAHGAGFGAVAAVLGLQGGLRRLPIANPEKIPVRGHPYPTDPALSWLANILSHPPTGLSKQN
jgi:hypothetical protein